MKKLILIIFILFTVIGCVKSQTVKFHDSYDNESEFIDAFLQARFSRFISNDIPLIIENQLSIHDLLSFNRFDSKSSIDDLENDLSERAKKHSSNLVEAVKDFCDKNSKSITIADLADIKCTHEILTKDEYKEIFQKNRSASDNPWELFYSKHPKSPGIITLSKPGFSSDGCLGIIYLENIRETLVGYSKLFVMEKKNGEWVDVDISIGASISY